MDISVLKKEIRKFAKERDWEQFHTPKNLIMPLTGEVGELCEIFQWLNNEQAEKPDATTKQEASEELADILIYLIRIFDILDIDPEKAVNEKLKINRKKYPVELSLGNAIKYNKRN